MPSHSSPNAVAARYDRRTKRVVVTLDTGIELAFRPEATEGLAGATGADLATIEVTSRGLGLHWPALDADVSIAGLLAGRLGSANWMARMLGAKDGKARTPAKAAAARANGAKAGRPKKMA